MMPQVCNTDSLWTQVDKKYVYNCHDCNSVFSAILLNLSSDCPVQTSGGDPTVLPSSGRCISS